MDKIGRLAFLHFEKALVAVLGAALLYSVVAYGPWKGRKDFSTELTRLAAQLNSLPVRTPDDVPPQPNLGDITMKADFAVFQPPADIIWPVSEKKEGDFLPPINVAAEPSRGYTEVKWELNPNQTPLDNVKPIGVQVERAMVAESGMGPFENLTASGGNEYMTPVELYKLAQRYAPVVIETNKRQSDGSGAKTGLKEDDLFNAFYDGRIGASEMNSVVSGLLRSGAWSAEDRMSFTETWQSIGMSARLIQMERRDNGQPPLAPEEARKAALEAMGFRGGGNYNPGATVVTATVQEAPDQPKVAVPVSVEFDDVTKFVDADVSPDQEYMYRVRFWTADEAAVVSSTRPSGWSSETQAVSSKPDTEFVLQGVSIEQNVAMILVRKWQPSTNNWLSQTYQVAPGEEIGRVEMTPKKDSRGNYVLDAAGNRQMEAVDFSTDCVLLDFGLRPRSFEQTTTTYDYDPITLARLQVDKVERLLYDTPQIVYTDRKGRLRLKWQTLASVS